MYVDHTQNTENNAQIAYRYEILGRLGKGSFGVVLKCLDHQTQRVVAVKIVRNKKRYRQQGEIEVENGYGIGDHYIESVLLSLCCALTIRLTRDANQSTPFLCFLQLGILKHIRDMDPNDENSVIHVM